MDQPNVSYSKSWVDHDLQEPLITAPRPQPRALLCCENKIVNSVVTFTSNMLYPPLLVFGLVLMLVDATFFLLLLFKVVDLGSIKLNTNWLNLTIQVFMGLYTYGCIAIFARRVRGIVRLYQMKAANVPDGTDWEGQTSSKIFDYIPLVHRLNIVVLLVLMCIFQFINQGLHIRYFSYKLADKDTSEIVLTNVFFLLSIFCGFVASLYQFCMQLVVKMSGRAPTGNEDSSSSPLAAPLAI